MLDVQALSVAHPRREGGFSEVVRGVSFTLGRERLGIIGESGSGKSQTGRAIMGLTAPGGQVTAKRLNFDGIDLLNFPPAQRGSLRAGCIAVVLQDPKYSLDPVMMLGAGIGFSNALFPSSWHPERDRARRLVRLSLSTEAAAVCRALTALQKIVRLGRCLRVIPGHQGTSTDPANPRTQPTPSALVAG